jgi:hypothetical protein
MIGIDPSGKSTEAIITEDEYSQRLESVMSTYIDSALPVLNRWDASSSGWMVRTFVIGVGINAEAGVGSVKVGAFPRFRLAFTNSKDPTLP